MADLASRFESNPIFKPSDLQPSRDSLEVECVLNPGAFEYQGKIGLLLRVAERPRRREGVLSVPILSSRNAGEIEVIDFDRSDPELSLRDPRIFTYKGRTYLTTLSHLRLAWSDDGRRFTAEKSPAVTGQGPLEIYGIEDCRVTKFDGRYFLTYSAVSPCGVGIGMARTEDWVNFTHMGMVFPPDNKDCALFDRKIGGNYAALHRPANYHIIGRHIWISVSPDLVHWGEYKCLAMTRPGMWDSERVGAGGPPIYTERGWLVIYHGADESSRYCLGALLLDRDDPSKVLARSEEPIMEPRESYELHGFLGNVVFSNGHIVDGDTIILYYGSSDTVVCGATVSIEKILGTLG